jgi:TRAP-type mannitol/chloroaromatic compound transport system permease small subunit
MGAAGYGLMRGVHIRADFLYRNWSDKTQATVDAVLYMAFFIPSMTFFYHHCSPILASSLPNWRNSI